MRKVRIAKHADADGVIRDLAIEDSEILGPAVLVALGADNEISECEYAWSGDRGAVEFSAERPRILLLAGCSLRRCKFRPDVDTSALRS